MPIYEYRCHSCKQKVSIFFRSFSAVDQESARCPNCGSAELRKLMPRVRVLRGEASSAGSDDNFDDSMLDGLDENDPKSLGRMMRRMADETGEDLGPEFGEVITRLEKGEDPEAIEQSMPELGDMTGDEAGGPGGDSMAGLPGSPGDLSDIE
ncbi:MAG TPA: FmdB family zinc ribbon protein [Anaerolineae bacterium]|nr:FmdB family zinc ribbon protein [Anaerolineae bacterium]